MARRPGSRYSRLVRFLRIGLPLLAIALMSSIFLVQEDRLIGGIEFSAEDIQTLGDGMRLSNPRFAGSTEAGEPFVVRADWAQPDSPDPEEIVMHGIVARITMADGRTVNMTADEGTLKPGDQTVVLTGRVRITSSDGYEAETDRAEADIRRRTLTTPGAVRADGPLGEIEAGSMHVLRPPAPETDDEEGAAEEAPGGDDQVVVFENRVRVVYRPNAAQPTGGSE